MDYNLQIQKLLVKKDAAPLPDDKIRILKEAIAIADSHNDMEWSYDLRLDIMDEEYYTARFTERFAAFAWLLEVCNQHPDLFDEDELLWRYRWMIHAARMNADISLEQIAHINDDFKVRMQRNGYGLRAYYDDEFRRNFIANEIDKAKLCLDLREKEQTNNMVCPACEATDKIDYHLRLGNHDEALAIFNEMMAKKYECMRKPFDTFCSFVQYYVKNGELEKAHEMFLKAEEKLAELENNDTSPIARISDLINFLSHYNHDEAWAWIERYIHWSIDATDETLFRVAINLLHLLRGEGTRKLKISVNMPWYRPDGVYNIAELYAYYHNLATPLAQRFDARNGNNYFTEQFNTATKA